VLRTRFGFGDDNPLSFPERSDGNLKRRLARGDGTVSFGEAVMLASLAFIALLGLLELLGLLGFLRASHAFTVMDMPSKRISVFGLFLIFDFLFLI
jgi:hypothetical protein